MKRETESERSKACSHACSLLGLGPQPLAAGLRLAIWIQYSVDSRLPGWPAWEDTGGTVWTARRNESYELSILLSIRLDLFQEP